MNFAECVSCGRTTQVYACNNCKRCRICQCSCRICVDCTKRTQTKVSHPTWRFCTKCNACTKVCKCIASPKYVPFKPPQTKFDINPLRRSLGLEIELSTQGNLPSSNLYTIIRDGSVNGDGKEVVVYPNLGDQYIINTINIGKQLLDAGSVANESCGFHVHVGAEDLRAFELRRLLWIYKQMEGELYKFVFDPSRSTNRFCKKLEHQAQFYVNLWQAKTSSEIRRLIWEGLYKVTFNKKEGHMDVFHSPGVNTIRMEKYQGCRYFGLNIHSQLYRGTMEWRQHHGTTNLGDLLYWPLFCGWVVEFAHKWTDKEAKSISSLKDVISSLPTNISDWINLKLGVTKS